MEKKWRNCELHNVNDAEAIDAGYNLTHFEIYCDGEMAKCFDAIIAGKAVYHF